MLPSNIPSVRTTATTSVSHESDHKDDSSDASSSSGERNSLTEPITSPKRENITGAFPDWSGIAPEVKMNNEGEKKDAEDTEPSYIDNRIYVSNIPFSYTSVDLEKIFSRFGGVLAAQIVSNERGSKGFGFVTLDTKEACERARDELDGTVMGGRRIEVKRARQMHHVHGRCPSGNAAIRTNQNARSLLSPGLIPPYPPDHLKNTMNGLNGLGTDSLAGNHLLAYGGLNAATNSATINQQILVQLQTANLLMAQQQAMHATGLLNPLLMNPYLNLAAMNMLDPTAHLRQSAAASLHLSSSLMNDVSTSPSLGVPPSMDSSNLGYPPQMDPTALAALLSGSVATTNPGGFL